MHENYRQLKKCRKWNREWNKTVGVSSSIFMESVQGLGGQDLASRLDKQTISRRELPRIKKEIAYEKMTRVKNSNLDGNTSVHI